MNNPILDLINSLNPNTVNTTGLMQGANSRFESGFNSLQSVADNIDKVRTNRNIKNLIANTDMSDPYAGQQSMLSNLLGIRGVDTKDAMSISNGIANPLIARNNRAEDVTYRNTKESNLQTYRNNTQTETGRHNKAMENKGFAPKGFSMITDDLGNVYQYNKDNGEYKVIKESTLGGINPKHVTLKSVTSRDASGVETTIQVPFNKLTGQPISVQKTEGNITTGITPSNASIGVSGTGVKMPSKLDKTTQLPSGQTVYVDASGKPYTNDKGQYLVKTQGAENVKRESAKKDIGNTLTQLDNILTRVNRDPSSVGSIGSDFGNWVGNQVNDYLKVPTGTRLNRNQIDATSGVIAAGLRKGVESGVMTESDFVRYQKLVPNVNDSPQEATYKGQQLMNQLSTQFGVVPPGFKRQRNTETGEYRLVREK